MDQPPSIYDFDTIYKRIQELKTNPGIPPDYEERLREIEEEWRPHSKLPKDCDYYESWSFRRNGRAYW